MIRRRGVVAWALALGFAVLTAAADPKPDAAPTVEATVTDAAGNDVKVSGAPTAGVRKLAWLPGAPLAIDFRDEHSTNYTVGVSTLVPLSTVESLQYEQAKQGKATIRTARLKVAGHDKPLSGPGQYKGINQIGFDGTVNGNVVKYLAGSPKNGVAAIRFPAAKPATHTPAGGPVWVVKVEQARVGTPGQEISNPKALFSSAKGGETLVDTLPVRKGEPIPVGRIKRLDVIAVNPTTKVAAVDVTLNDGTERTVVIPQVAGTGDQAMTFLGFVGEVPVGWKLVPIHAIQSLERK